MSNKAAAGYVGLFVMGLVFLSVGASQHNGTFTILGAVFMVMASVGGFVTRKKKSSSQTDEDDSASGL